MMPFPTRQPAALPLFTALPRAAWLAHPPDSLPPKPNATIEQLHPLEPQAPADAVVVLLPSLLRLGDFIVGDTDCPTLYGHPDIRY